jgi:predicted tellurium resistance membrane protein TerC
MKSRIYIAWYVIIAIGVTMMILSTMEAIHTFYTSPGFYQGVFWVLFGEIMLDRWRTKYA